MNRDVHIALVDDHRMFTDGFSAFLAETGADYQVTTFEDPVAFLEAATGDAKFDLVILDLVMRGMNGLALLAAISKFKRRPRVLMLSGIATSPPIGEMKRLGASGFVPKSAEISVLQDAVTAILSGQTVFPEDVEESTPVAHSYADVWHAASAPPALAKRQLEILKMIGEGATNKHIAATLFISENTVKSHLRAIFESLGVRTRTACVHKAVLLGLI